MSDPARPVPDGIRPEVWQAYLDAPEHCVAEILGGELYVMPRPRPRHASAAGRLHGRLRGFDDPDDDEPGGGVILMEPELHLGPLDKAVVPDLAGWRASACPRTSWIGMAMGIGLVMLCMIVTPSLALGAVAYGLAPKTPRPARPIAAIVRVLAGPVIGLAVVMATFELPLSYFVDWADPSPPPPALLHDAPADAGHE